MSPTARTLTYWLSATLLALSTALVIEGIFGLPLILCWLIGMNLFAFVYYGIDKLNAIWVDDIEARAALRLRIPEAALLLLAAAGGSLGAGLAIVLLSHKTGKGWFLAAFAAVVLLQALLVFLFWDLLPFS
jgi:uncharacterized membrane protein YsdA (DUF1294 family)